VELIESERISFSMAKRVLAALWEEPTLSAATYVEEKDLHQLTSEEEILPIIEAVLAEDPESAADYLAGKDKALMALMGAVMRRTRGRAHPERTRTLLERKLEEKR
jgi:aspartyl-tRNA(Asn)/glutamyl-tRNA(Gln) amidotransferase subunit B